MADILPPIPYDKPQTSYEWIDWYTKLIHLVNTSTIPHNSLAGLQGVGTDYYHLSLAQYGALHDQITVQDEGTPLTQRATWNFTGAGVVATDAGGKTVVTITGAPAGGVDLMPTMLLMGA